METRHTLLDTLPITVLCSLYAIEIGIVSGNIAVVLFEESANANWIIMQGSYSVSMMASCVVQLAVQV